MTKMKSPALGKGLEALLGSIDKNSVKTEDKKAEINAEIAYIPLSDIIPNPEQPRKEFDEQSLQELAMSIKENGVIVPITVNKHGGKYMIIAGERRFRASKQAGLKEIPAYIRVVTEQQSMQMALIENIQREDLNAMEIALSMKALCEQTGLSHQELGNKLGKSRSNVANYIRLLNLPAEIQLSIRADELSMGHARALIALEDEKQQIELVRKIIKDGLSVREVESAVKKLKEAEVKTKTNQKKQLPQLHNEFVTAMTERLQTPITVKRSQRGKGTITIAFKNDKEFERIVSLLKNK